MRNSEQPRNTIQTDARDAAAQISGEEKGLSHGVEVVIHGVGADTPQVGDKACAICDGIMAAGIDTASAIWELALIVELLTSSRSNQREEGKKRARMMVKRGDLHNIT